ncbi:MAG: hypothetical protein ACRC1H_06295 [Caldilineaceae bacterium]
MTPARDLSAREADALASMMGADSRRIDDLVGDVGEIKGAVITLQSGVGGLKEGVDELRGGMIALTRLSINLERQAEDHGKTQAQMNAIDGRLRIVETTIATDLPPLRETRGDIRKIQWLVIAAVATAVLTIVLKVVKP